MAVHSKWSDGHLIFYDGTQTILTIKNSSDGVFINTSQATPALNDGQAFGHTVECTVSGVGTGNAAASASWLNITGTAAAGGYHCARTDGIWEPDTATVTDSTLVFGAKMQAIVGSTGFSRLVPFCLNATQDISALFMIGSPDSKAGITLGSTGMASQSGSLKMAIDSNAIVYYVKLYSDPAS